MLSLQEHRDCRGSVRVHYQINTNTNTIIVVDRSGDSQGSLMSGPQSRRRSGAFSGLLCSPLSYCTLISLKFKSIRTLVDNNLTEVFRGRVDQWGKQGGGSQGFTIHMPEATPAS